MPYPTPNEMSHTELETFRQELQLSALQPDLMFSLEHAKLLWLVEQVLGRSLRYDSAGACTGTLVHDEFTACPVHD